MGLGVLVLHAEYVGAFACNLKNSNFLCALPALIQVCLKFVIDLGFLFDWLLGHRWGGLRRCYYWVDSFDNRGGLMLTVHFRVR